MTIVYLLRHGRTALNAAGALRGRMDVPLDEVGREEARRLGAAFSGVELGEVVSSPLGRSMETATAVADRQGLPVTPDPGFIDRDYGPWTGKAPSAVSDRYGALESAPASEIEPYAQFQDRVTRALAAVVARLPDRRVAIAAHDAVNRAIIARHCADWRGAFDRIPQPTGCWNRLVFEPGQPCRCAVIGALPGDGNAP